MLFFWTFKHLLKFISFFFWLLRAASEAYGGSQARSPSELQLPAYTTATSTQDPSHVYHLHHSSRQCQISDPLSKARGQTCVLMDTSQIPFHYTTMGTPEIYSNFKYIYKYHPLMKNGQF